MWQGNRKGRENDAEDFNSDGKKVKNTFGETTTIRVEKNN